MSDMREELYMRDVVGGIHHTPKLIERIEAIHRDMTDLILWQNGVNMDTVDYTKEIKVSGVLV